MPEPIRILHMIGCFEMGGSQSMVLNLYRTIDRSKVQFDFIVDHPEINELESAFVELGARIFTMPSFRGTNILEIKSKWNRFFKEHPEYKVLHSHVRSYASIYLAVAKKNGVKTIIHSHNTANGTGISALVKATLQLPLRYQADYMFACSRIAGEWLFGKKSLNKKNYKMIPNAVDTERFKFSEDNRKVFREEIHVTENTIVLGHVGRFHEQKNHSFLIQMFKCYHDENKNSVLVLVGDGELRSAVEHQIKELGLENFVFLLGNRKDVYKILSGLDCLVFPSKWEGLPVTLVEAQAAGLKCLVSDTVTRDIAISDLIEYIPITEGTSVWIDTLKKSNLSKKDVSNLIVKSGFDINATASWLSDFYLSLTNS